MMPKSASLRLLPNPTFSASVAFELDSRLQPAGLRENSSSRSPDQAWALKYILPGWTGILSLIWSPLNYLPRSQTVPLNTMTKGTWAQITFSYLSIESKKSKNNWLIKRQLYVRDYTMCFLYIILFYPNNNLLMLVLLFPSHEWGN